MQLTVAIIGAPHGLKGEVRLDVRTDVPERRLAVGTMLETDPQEAGPLTIERSREYKGATYVIFSECRDRTGAEALRGISLVVETDEEEEIEEFIHTIPDSKTRQVFIYRYMMELSWREIARKMNYSESGVRFRLHDCYLRSLE